MRFYSTALPSKVGISGAFRWHRKVLHTHTNTVRGPKHPPRRSAAGTGDSLADVLNVRGRAPGRPRKPDFNRKGYWQGCFVSVRRDLCQAFCSSFCGSCRFASGFSFVSCGFVSRADFPSPEDPFVSWVSGVPRRGTFPDTSDTKVTGT
jgi:hypothetical protein